MKNSAIRSVAEVRSKLTCSGAGEHPPKASINSAAIALELADELVKRGIVESVSVWHVERLLNTDSHTHCWHLVSDCLNTHQSESLVRLVAEWEGLDILPK